MDLLHQFITHIKSRNLFRVKDRLLLAVSGGVDSIVLCDLCSREGYDFSIAHCNFGLRGTESDEDEQFVKALASGYKVPFFVKKFDTQKYADENGLSIQVAARDLRYQWFEELMKREGEQPFDCLLTAHHANDNVETLLMNFFKGTGIAGLQGIPETRNNGMRIVRPLLDFKKEQLLKFAVDHDLSYREDSSNLTDKYTRNYLRNKLIPALKEIYPAVEDNLLDNIRRFKDAEALYRLSLESLKKKLIVQKGNEVHIPVNKLLKTVALDTVVYEIIKDFGFDTGQVPELVKLLHSGSGKYIVSATHRILHNRDWLIISALHDQASGHVLIHEQDVEILCGNQKLHIKRTGIPVKLETAAHIAQLDAGEIVFPLLLRKWKPGDYFYPLGMKKKKKLARFFIDQKLSLLEKENTWVLEMDKRIIWVVGQRIDDRFKITGKTKEVIRFTVSDR